MLAVRDMSEARVEVLEPGPRPTLILLAAEPALEVGLLPCQQRRAIDTSSHQNPGLPSI